MTNASSLLAIPVCLALLAGCSRPASPELPESPAANEAAAKDQAAKDVAAKDQAASAGDKPLPIPPAKAVPDDDPAVALQALAESTAAGDADRLLAALPDDVRRRLDAWWNESLLTIDPQLRTEVAASVGMLAEALLARREFVLATDRIQFEGSASGLVRRRFDDVVHAAIELAKWPGWSTTEGDAGAAPLVNRLVEIIAAEPALTQELRELSFETVSRDGDRAVVRVTGVDRSSPFELAMTKRNDRWIPATIAHAVAADDAGDASVDPAARQAALTSFSSGLRDVASVLESASTQAAFDAQVDRAAALLMASAGRAMTPPRPVGTGETVTVHVLGTFDAAEKDRLLWEIVSKTDAPASGVGEAVDRPEDDGISISVGPVADVEAFAGRLGEFAIDGVDVSTRTITVRRNEP